MKMYTYKEKITSRYTISWRRTNQFPNVRQQIATDMMMDKVKKLITKKRF